METIVVTTTTFVNNGVIIRYVTILGHGLRGVLRGNDVFKGRELRKAKSVVNWEEEEQLKKSMVETIQRI